MERKFSCQRIEFHQLLIHFCGVVYKGIPVRIQIELSLSTHCLKNCPVFSPFLFCFSGTTAQPELIRPLLAQSAAKRTHFTFILHFIDTFRRVSGRHIYENIHHYSNGYCSIWFLIKEINRSLY